MIYHIAKGVDVTMRKTCKYFISIKKCAVDGNEPNCKYCGCYVKESYIENMLKKYGRSRE